jgi:hypothetical protein
VRCWRGRPDRTRGTIVRASVVRASSTHGAWVELDGEPFGPIPARFELERDALTLVTP